MKTGFRNMMHLMCYAIGGTLSATAFVLIVMTTMATAQDAAESDKVVHSHYFLNKATLAEDE